jgi:hypothetical protein
MDHQVSVYELLSLKSQHEYQSKLGNSKFVPEEPLPDGIVPLKCNQCKIPISGALIYLASEIGKDYP